MTALLPPPLRTMKVGLFPHQGALQLHFFVFEALFEKVQLCPIAKLLCCVATCLSVLSAFFRGTGLRCRVVFFAGRCSTGTPQAPVNRILQTYGPITKRRTTAVRSNCGEICTALRVSERATPVRKDLTLVLSDF